LVGAPPGEDNYALNGTFAKVVNAAGSEPTQTAVLNISGELDLPTGPSAVGAEIQFTFARAGATPLAPQADAVTKSAGSQLEPRAKKGLEGLVAARGWISDVRMALATTIPVLDDDDGRLKQTTTYELVLKRKALTAPPEGSGKAAPAPLNIPDAPPVPNLANSWIVYDDYPLGRFHFRHPQDLHLPSGMLDPDGVELVGEERAQPDRHMTINIKSKGKTVEDDRQLRDPDFHRRVLFKTWEDNKREVQRGPTEWLPAKTWDPLKRKVYRIEAALLPRGSEQGALRYYCDYYLVLFATNQVVVVQATTKQEPHIPFRDQAEEVIKSFEFGPWKAQTSPAAPPEAAGAPSPSP
jgi:hypothetical protein